VHHVVNLRQVGGVPGVEQRLQLRVLEALQQRVLARASLSRQTDRQNALSDALLLSLSRDTAPLLAAGAVERGAVG
jgi:hypothetical protein